MHAKLHTIENKAILNIANKLPQQGTLAISNGLSYLSVDKRYIYDTYPLLELPNKQMPNYFAEGREGAHITVIYPEEKKRIQKSDLGIEHAFEIIGLASAEIAQKTYYVLLVYSQSLMSVRKKLSLPPLLCFRGYQIPFHITCAVSKVVDS